MTAGRERLRGLVLLEIDDPILELAATIGPESLRSLDAIHLATAQQLGDDLGVVVTYDRRLPVASPA